MLVNYIQAYSPEDDDDDDYNGVLTSPTLPHKTTNDCFSFYYYSYGEVVNYLKLNLVTDVGTQNLWSRFDSAGDMWHKVSINIGKQNSSYKVSF